MWSKCPSAESERSGIVSPAPEQPSAEWLHQELQARFPELRHLIGLGGWIVGGAIRDLLAGRSILDADLVFDDAVAAAQHLARKANARVITLGRPGVEAHRVVTSGRVYDFAALTRGNIASDLSRRDFTLNAIALELDDPNSLLDPFGGRADLHDRVVRHIAEENFSDDPLRLAKAVRMAVTLEFDLDPETSKILSRHAEELERVAAERVWVELQLIAAADFARGLELLRDTGLLSQLGIAWDDRAVERLRELGPVTATTAFAAFLASADENTIESLADRWKVPAAERRTWLVQRRLWRSAASGELSDDCRRRVTIYDAGREESERFVAIARAARLPVAEPLAGVVEQKMDEIEACDGLLDGEELRQRFGLSGKQIGVWKRRLLESQICGLVSTREAAIEFVSERLRQQLDVDASEADGDLH